MKTSFVVFAILIAASIARPVTARTIEPERAKDFLTTLYATV